MDNNILDEARLVYQISVEDLQSVANDELERDLTEEEIMKIEDIIGDYIDWYGTISECISKITGE
jgi:hypothetical protein